MSGSCALLTMYNTSTGTLYTACTGDSRAVLGRQDLDGNVVYVELRIESHTNNISLMVDSSDCTHLDGTGNIHGFVFEEEVAMGKKG